MFLNSAWALMVAACCVQLRLLCNLLDGMVAIEGGKSSPLGAIYNELPDRIADSLFLIALGYAATMPTLGWLCALLAAITAYIRVLGGTFGLPQDFSGWFAKPRRMAILTLGLIPAAIEKIWMGSNFILLVTVWILAIGTATTCITRTRNIAVNLKKNAHGI